MSISPDRPRSEAPGYRRKLDFFETLFKSGDLEADHKATARLDSHLSARLTGTASWIVTCRGITALPFSATNSSRFQVCICDGHNLQPVVALPDAQLLWSWFLWEREDVVDAWAPLGFSRSTSNSMSDGDMNCMQVTSLPFLTMFARPSLTLPNYPFQGPIPSLQGSL
jgi:hypothetical protein